METAALELELKRRRTKHNIKVGPMMVALDYDEMLAVQEQLAPFLKPAPVIRGLFSDLLETMPKCNDLS